MITKVTSLLGSWVVLLGAWQASAADLEISIPIQITHAQNFDPSPSPDGKKLVFISMLSGKEQLFTMDADGKNIAQLTRDDADHEDPAWSPDGKKIAFVLHHQGTDQHRGDERGRQQRRRAHAEGAQHHSPELVGGQQAGDLLHE